MKKRSPRKRNSISVCIIEQNPLAECKLTQVLHACSIHVLRKNNIFTCPGLVEKQVPVFILDSGSIRAPLSRVLRFLRVKFPAAKTIVLDENQSPDEVCGLLLLGVHGYVPYQNVDQCLGKAIRKVANGHLWVPEEVLEKYVAYSTKISCFSKKEMSEITHREKQILELIQRRFSNKEIASILKISVSTVKFHLMNIFKKTGLHDRHDLAEQTPLILRVEQTYSET